MYCEWDKELAAGGVYQCRHCDQKTFRLAVAGEVRRVCPVASGGLKPGSDEWKAKALGSEVGIDVLAEGSKKGYLMGDLIASLTTAIGVPPCGGCEARQEWLNNAHRWLLDKFK